MSHLEGLSLPLVPPSLSGGGTLNTEDLKTAMRKLEDECGSFKDTLKALQQRHTELQRETAAKQAQFLRKRQEQEQEEQREAERLELEAKGKAQAEAEARASRAAAAAAKREKAAEEKAAFLEKVKSKRKLVTAAGLEPSEGAPATTG